MESKITWILHSDVLTQRVPDNRNGINKFEY